MADIDSTNSVKLIKQVCIFMLLLLAGLLVVCGLIPKMMDLSANQCSIKKAELGADYNTIFATSLDSIKFITGFKIPNARFSYVLESPEPLVLKEAAQFPAIPLNKGQWWPYDSYPWISKCLYRPSFIKGAEGPKGEIFIYCNDKMTRVCVLGCYKEDDIILPVYPDAINVQTPDSLLKTGQYEKIIEFDLPASIASDKVFNFYTKELCYVQWQPVTTEASNSIKYFKCGKQLAAVKIDKTDKILHVCAFIQSEAR